MARRFSQGAGGILSYFTRHRTAANLLLVLLLVLGMAAVPNMRAQFFPDVVVDDIDISVVWEGAGAEDVDRAIVQVLEPALLAVEGVESSSSRSFEGRASISLEFEPGYDMGRAGDDVQQAMDSVTTLPDEAEDPELVRGVWYDRVTDLIITGPVGTEQLGLFTDELVNRLFAAGVTRTTIRGVAAPRTLIEVPSVNLMAHDVTIQQIAAAIAEEVDADPAGDVTGANARVRTGVEKRNPDQIARIVLRSNPDGSTLTVGDVAEVRVEGVTRNRGYFVGPNPAMSIRVDRSSAGDAIAIQHQVEKVARDMQATLPEGTTIELIRTRAEAISGRLNILIDNGLMGLGLVLALLFLFLNARTAFWVAAGIPVAMLTAIALMYVAGLTINMISLFALIITLGIVVDDAIVVGEHADARARRMGESPVEAAENAARRMAMPVFSATLTTIIAFFGLTAISGRFGNLIADIPFTVIVVLAASLIECFLILPHHMSHALKTRDRTGFSPLRVLLGGIGTVIVGSIVVGLAILAFLWAPGAIAASFELMGAEKAPLFIARAAEWSAPLFDGVLERFVPLSLGLTAAVALVVALRLAMMGRAARGVVLREFNEQGIDITSTLVNRAFLRLRDGWFRSLMGWVIRARYAVLAGAIVILATQAALFIRGDVQWRFFNAPESGSVTGNFAMLPGATREDTLEMMREMQRATEALGAEYEERYGRNPLDYVLAEIGGNSGRPLPGSETKDGDLLGGIAIELIDADLRPYSSFQFVGELQDRVQRHPLAETVSFRGWRSGPGGEALDVQFYGADAETLKAASEALKTALLRFPEVSAVEDDLPYDKEELVLELTPQGQSLGFTIDGVGRVLRARLNGLEAATYPLGPRSAEIRVQLPERELTADFLERMQMRAPSGAYVPLADIVSVERSTGFSTVRRQNGIRLISVTGDISEDDPARAEEVMRALQEEILPEIAARQQVEWQLSGLSEQEDEFLSDAATGLILCLTGIYIVLAWVFSSWTRPIVVMAIIPFGMVGTIWGHYIWDVPLSMFTVVGLLGMTGIIINDSIVLVTTIDDHAQDRGLIPSIIDGAADRLRPVMLTTMTTVLGLAPLLYEQSQQAQFLKPTVITLVYGLGFGMVLVLIVVPALMAMQQDVSRQVTALKRSLRSRALRGAMLPSLALVLGWLALTMGWVLVTGALHPQIAGLVPVSGDLPAMAAAMALFLSGVAVLVGMLFGALGLAHLLRGRRAT